MHKTALLVCLLVAGCVSASAEGYGYGFLGIPDPVRGGLGGEWGGMVKFGGEVGSLNRNAALFSGNVSFHIPVNGRIDPFATGGLSFAAGGDPSLFVNIGGGVNYWWKQRFGFRGELRPHIHLSGDRETFTEFRFGVVFR